MVDPVRIDFGGCPVGSAASAIPWWIPTRLRLSDLPPDVAIVVPVNLQNLPPPYALGSVTYPTVLRALFGDVSIKYRVAALTLENGLDFSIELDAAGPFVSDDEEGLVRAVIRFIPIATGARSDTVHPQLTNLELAVPAAGVASVILDLVGSLMSHTLASYASSTLTGALTGVGYSAPSVAGSAVGAPGPPGPAGPSGPQGVPGPQGLPARTTVTIQSRPDIYVSNRPGQMAFQSHAELAHLDVPAGSYLIIVQMTLETGPPEGAGYFAEFALSTCARVRAEFGVGILRANVDGFLFWPVVMHDVALLDRPTTISLFGDATVGDAATRKVDEIGVDGLTLMAIRVGNINPRFVHVERQIPSGDEPSDMPWKHDISR